MVTLRSNSLSADIDAKGAELCSVKNAEGLEFIWQAEKTVWARHAPVLFPIVGRLKENYFLFENKKYELPQHGFARDKEFTLISRNSSQCIFRLASDNDTQKSYPFDFTLDVTYTLNENILTVGYSIRNKSQPEIFFSIGAHPGFRCPLLKGEAFEDYYLEFGRNDLKFTTLKEGLLDTNYKNKELTDFKMPLNVPLFDSDALVLENHQVNSVTLASEKNAHRITLRCNDWPYFGIWTKKGCDQFICLEPWYGITDTAGSNNEIKNKKGIIKLGSDTEFHCSHSISFQ